MSERYSPSVVTALELVTYRKEDIAYASSTLIKDFAKYSGIVGTQRWVNSLMDLLSAIMYESPTPTFFAARGVNLGFSGFSHKLRPVIEDSTVLFRAREPRFVIAESQEGIPVWERGDTDKVVARIAEEMHDVYRLRVETNPLALVFPKNEYGEVSIVPAKLL